MMPANWPRCSKAYIIVTMPSTRKNAISRSVSDTVPLIGQRSSTIPAAMPTTPEISAHQKPGTLRGINVLFGGAAMPYLKVMELASEYL